MRSLISIALLAFPSISFAQSVHPVKLVVVWNNRAVAITDYPSLSRCQAAAIVLKQRSDDAAREPVQTLPSGGFIIPAHKYIESFCIPG